MPTTSSSPTAYLLSTTHSKDVRFPWVTLYQRGSSKKLQFLEKLLQHLVAKSDTDEMKSSSSRIYQRVVFTEAPFFRQGRKITFFFPKCTIEIM